METRSGFVFILDALGASNFDKDKIQIYLNGRAEINKLVTGVIESTGNSDLVESCDIFTFGDTVLLAVGVKPDVEVGKALVVPVMCMEIHMLFSFVKNHILYRGAYSIGEFYVDSESNTVMGPAVSDAASWYESANMPALISTPKCKVSIEYHFGKEKLVENFPIVHEYPVPLKSGGTKNLYLVPWLSRLFHDETQQRLFGQKVDDVDKIFLGILDRFDIPKGTEEKYENLLEYFQFAKKRRGFELKIKSGKP